MSFMFEYVCQADDMCVCVCLVYIYYTHVVCTVQYNPQSSSFALFWNSTQWNNDVNSISKWLQCSTNRSNSNAQPFEMQSTRFHKRKSCINIQRKSKKCHAMPPCTVHVYRFFLLRWQTFNFVLFSFLFIVKWFFLSFSLSVCCANGSIRYEYKCLCARLCIFF